MQTVFTVRKFESQTLGYQFLNYWQYSGGLRDVLKIPKEMKYFSSDYMYKERAIKEVAKPRN